VFFNKSISFFSFFTLLNHSLITFHSNPPKDTAKEKAVTATKPVKEYHILAFDNKSTKAAILTYTTKGSVIPSLPFLIPLASEDLISFLNYDLFRSNIQYFL